MQKNILSLHKKIYNFAKKKSQSFEFSQSGELHKYLSNQKKYSTRKFEISNIGHLLSKVRKSNIIYMGDFHTFEQNSKNLQKVIDILLKDGHKNVTLAIEMVHYSNQFFIDAFCNNYITELEFLESINYYESWRFPWNQYSVLFNMAKVHDLNIIGINSHGTLTQRDNFAANIILQEFKNNPDSKILVLMGELHILPNKLPQIIEKKFKKNKFSVKQTIIHQNIDEIYWKLNDKDFSSKIVKFSDQEFSIQSSPPWIKYESLIYWYETILEDEEFDIHKNIIDTGLKVLNSNGHDDFALIQKNIISLLKLDHFKQHDLEDYELIDYKKINTISKKIDQIPNNKLNNFFNFLLEHNYSFRLPHSKLYYVPTYSVNRLARIVGIHFFHLILQNNNFRNEDFLLQKNQVNKFIFFVHEYAISYLSSKVINPNIKCKYYLDLKDKEITQNIFFMSKKEINIVISLIETNKLNESIIKEKLRGFRLENHYNSGKLMGKIFGEFIFHKISTGPSKENNYEMIPLLFNDLITVNDFCYILNLIKKDKEFLSKRKIIF